MIQLGEICEDEECCENSDQCLGTVGACSSTEEGNSSEVEVDLD